MNKTLHILNGDSTAEIFSKSNNKGDILVWREMLCEGGLHADVGSDAFWKKRYTFFEEEMSITRLEYYDKIIKELIKIEEIAKYNEVVLWFEYDLFCQINLLALCTYLLKYYRKDIRYFLVCTGYEKDKNDLQTLSDYSSNDYEELFKNKIKLTRHNLLFAQRGWQLYVENNEENLKEFDVDQCSKFKYLQAAIHQHLQRFPTKNGLNQIENKILEIVNTENIDKKTLIKTLLVWQRKETIYGFGDSQYLLYLNKLADYIAVKNEIITLNAKGKELIK